MNGCLVLAATPMGDVGDASERLRTALTTADVVAAEDTRRTRHLASALGVTIGGRVVSFYDQVETTRLPALVEEIEQGRTVLLVTDAGMPSVSDPGYRLVAACVERDLPVTCLPGPSAVTTALALSGLPVERFCFDGFPPRKQGPRRAWLETLRGEARACVFFEAPHRLADTLAELAEWAADGVRGEITVVLEGARPVVVDPEDLVPVVERMVADGTRLKDACAAVATEGVSKREVYEAVLAARKD